jgi:hypothetical protein
MEQPIAPTSAPALEPPEVPLRHAIAEIIYGASQDSVERPWNPEWDTPSDLPVVNDAFDTADLVVQLLVEQGHVLPGAPPAQRIFDDAKRFHDQLTLTALALRILNMLAFNNVQTPETKPARKWIDDYLTGTHHGPAGQPMLWPGRLPGMAAMLRDWGFVPTIALPGQASYVARAQPNQTVQ